MILKRTGADGTRSAVRSKLRAHIRHNVVAYLALFIALGGTSAYAANEWNGSNIQDGTLTGADIQDLSLGLADYGANSITTGKLKDQDVRTADLRDLGVTNPKIAWDSVSSGKVINNNLTGDDINESTLNVVPQAHNAEEADFATNIAPGSADTDALLDGAVARELFAQNVPSGVTIRGRMGGTSTKPDPQEAAMPVISFPVRAPSVPPVSTNTAIGVKAVDPTCTGTLEEPTAPPGKVCLYWDFLRATQAAFDETRDGVVIRLFYNSVNLPAVGHGSWAYTAPL
jgi:hypothetical protein